MINKIIEIINKGAYPAILSSTYSILVGVNNLALVTTKGYIIYKRKDMSLDKVHHLVSDFIINEWNAQTIDEFFESCLEFKKSDFYMDNIAFLKLALEEKDWESINEFNLAANNDNLTGDVKSFILGYLNHDAINLYRCII